MALDGWEEREAMDKQELEQAVERLIKIVSTMNAVSRHQTDRVTFGMERPPRTGGIRTHVHPLTCGNDSDHTPLFPYYEDGKVKLICRDCDYTQDNAGPFGRD